MLKTIAGVMPSAFGAFPAQKYVAFWLHKIICCKFSPLKTNCRVICKKHGRRWAAVIYLSLKNFL